MLAFSTVSYYTNKLTRKYAKPSECQNTEEGMFWFLMIQAEKNGINGLK